MVIVGVSNHCSPLYQKFYTHKTQDCFAFAFHVHKGSLKSSFQGAVVGDQYKYLAQYDRGEIKSFYLFDINLESNEETNVSMAHPHLTNSMREELDTFLQSVKSSATYSGCLEYHDHRNSAKCRV